MKYFENVLELVGRTALVRLNRLADPATMATVLVKMEQLNPAGSVKDRMAVSMVARAEAEGVLKPGGTIVEATSGNTGMGLAMTAAVKGYRCIFTMPDKMSKEKIDMLKGYGAEVVITRTDVHHDDPESYVEVAKRIARETPGGYYINQYANMANPEAHYRTTGPEIWKDTDGLLDVLVGGIGTGGTISGAGRYIKEQAARAGRSVRIVCPDPFGSMYKDMHERGSAGPTHVYRVEGIGHDFMVDTLDLSVIDEVRNISDRDSFITARRLAREEGIFCGGSTGTAVFGALQVAKELGPGMLVVCILADSGDRYLSKCYNDAWMKDMGYLAPDDRLGKVRDLLRFKHGSVEFVRPEETLAHVARRMNDLGISQMPLAQSNGGPLMMVHEADLLQGLLSGHCSAADPVLRAAKPLQGIVTPDDPISKVQRVFDADNVAVVVEQQRITGIISKIDVVEFLAEATKRASAG